MRIPGGSWPGCSWCWDYWSVDEIDDGRIELGQVGRYVDGIHDLGGKHGFGSVNPQSDEPVFHARWEARVFAMNLQLGGNLDRSRHAIERIDPISYLADTYYGRWLGGLETRLVEDDVLSQSEISDRAQMLGAGRNDRVAARPNPSQTRRPDHQSSAPALATAERTLETLPRRFIDESECNQAHRRALHTRSIHPSVQCTKIQCPIATFGVICERYQ